MKLRIFLILLTGAASCSSPISPNFFRELFSKKARCKHYHKQTQVMKEQLSVTRRDIEAGKLSFKEMQLFQTKHARALLLYYKIKKECEQS